MRRRGAHRPLSGERQDYLASVSDLMSGLIFIFIITLVVFALRLAAKQAELKGTQDDLNRQHAELEGILGGITAGDKIAKTIGDALSKQLRLEGCQPQWDGDALVLHLPTEVIRFEIGEDHPHLSSERCVGVLAAALVEQLKCNVSTMDTLTPPTAMAPADAPRPGWCRPEPSDALRIDCGPTKHERPVVETLLIEGHTDSREIQGGRFRDNLELSAARASEVLRMMRRCEPYLDQLRNGMKQPVVSVTGYADMRLANPADPLADSNRRIDLRIVLELPKRAIQAASDGHAHVGTP